MGWIARDMDMVVEIRSLWRLDFGGDRGRDNRLVYGTTGHPGHARKIIAEISKQGVAGRHNSADLGLPARGADGVS